MSKCKVVERRYIRLVMRADEKNGELEVLLSSLIQELLCPRWTNRNRLYVFESYAHMIREGCVY